MTTEAPETSWPAVIGALVAGRDLGAGDTSWAMSQIMTGDATPAQIAGFAVALRAKGEVVDEVRGLVEAMYAHAVPFPSSGPAVDIVGTGGDQAQTVNISTMASLVIAGAGERVIKHGNRAASSACGSADVLERLGVRLDLPVPDVIRLAEQVGITFCFAPVFHPALRHAAVPRRELGVPTTFNILGPLANPARPSAQAVGVADLRLAGTVAGVLAARGVSALVFRGDDGLDELTTTTTSRVWEVRDGQVVQDVLDPAALGVPVARAEDLRGGDADHNADVVRRLLAGEPGPVRDTVVLNAAAGLVAAAPADGTPLGDRVVAAMRRAEQAIDSGAADRLLARWVEASA